jgi:hypothetical protein
MFADMGGPVIVKYRVLAARSGGWPRPWAGRRVRRESAMGEADREGAASYNYSHFDDYVAAGGDAADEAAFWNSFRAGQRAGEFTLLRLGDGAQVRLSELWGAKPLVMEFGSFT